MKFANGTRETFEVTQFNPGPGYYVSHDMGDKEIINQQKQLYSGEGSTTNWAKNTRFKKTHYILNNNPGAGTYNLKSDFVKHEQKSQKKNQNNDDEELLKVNAIPSIPSGNQVPGYQEIGDGLLILMKEPRKLKNLENLGPNSYNPNFNQVKSRVTGFVIKPEPQKRNNTASTIENKVPMNEFLQLQPLNQQRFTKQHHKKLENKSNDNFFEKQSINLLNPEYNLELLVLREKNLSKQNNGVPPPGHYYDNEKQSSIVLKKKPVEYQCFDSTTARFVYAMDNNPGVGDYQILHINQIGDTKNNLKFEKAPKLIPQVSETNIHKNPGVGEYELKSQFVLNSTKSQINISHPSVFGSGQQRFDKKISEVPGVGSYNCKLENKFGNQKKYKTILIQQNQNIQNEQKVQLDIVVQHDKQENTDKKSLENQREAIYEQFNQISDKQGSAFKSAVQRFTQQQNKKDFSSVGPGSYKVQTDMKRQTFNKISNPQINRVERNFSTQKGGANSTSKFIGPGSYNSDLDKIKKKSIYDIKMH